MNNPFRITESDILFQTGEFLYLHSGKKSLSSAYEIEAKAAVLIKIPRALSATKATIEIINAENNEFLAKIPLKWKARERDIDIYQSHLPTKPLGVGIYFLKLAFTTLIGNVFAQNDGGKIRFTKDNPSKLFQLTISDFKYAPPSKHYGGVIYQIFVDRFNKGKCTASENKAKRLCDWDAPIPEYPHYIGEPIKNDYFYGGNLRGITDKLSYIKSLGVTAIYLSPIFKSPSNHKYDTADYMSVDEAFGGEQELKALIKKAKRMGISIILDGVFNHTGSDSIYFNKNGSYDTIGAYQSKESKYHSWYTFDSFPDKYSSWWGIDILPKINTEIPECRGFFVGKGGVIEKYAEMGIGGMRLDVADELSDSFIADIKKKLDENNKEALLYGEVWEDASNKIAYGKLKKYYLGTELDGVMNYPLRNGLIDFLKYNNDKKLNYALREVTFNAPKRIRDAQMNILGTHDTERIITVLGGADSCEKTIDQLSTLKMNTDEYEKGRKLLLQGLTALFTLPGIPCIFYGDEAGLQGYGDPFNRRAFPWDDIDSTILEHCRMLATIRRANEVYREGDFELLHLENGILIFKRTHKGSSYLTILNNTENATQIKFSKKSVSLFDNKINTDFTIAPKGSSIIKSKNNIQFEI